MFRFREVHFWGLLCVFCCVSVLLVLLNPEAGVFSPLWVEVAGTTLGVALVISFERTTRLAVDIRKGNALALSKELVVGLLSLGRGDLEKAGMDLWEMAKSTGNLALITSEEKWQFLGMYRVIGIYNESIERHELTLVTPEASEKQLALFKEKAEGFSTAIVDLIPEILEKVMGPGFLEQFDESLWKS